MHLVAASTQILDLKLNLNDILNSILNGAQAWLLELWMDCCTLQDSTALQSMNGEQRRPVMENRQGKRTSSGPPNWQRWAPAHTNTGTEPSAEAERGTYRLQLADKRAQTNPVSAETHVPLQAVRRQRCMQTPVVLSLCARLHLPAKLSLLCRHPHNGGRGGIKRKWHAGWHPLCEEMSLQAWGLQVLSAAQGWWLTLTIACHIHVSGSVCSCPLKDFKAWPLRRMR